MRGWQLATRRPASDSVVLAGTAAPDSIILLDSLPEARNLTTGDPK